MRMINHIRTPLLTGKELMTQFLLVPPLSHLASGTCWASFRGLPDCASASNQSVTSIDKRTQDDSLEQSCGLCQLCSTLSMLLICSLVTTPSLLTVSLLVFAIATRTSLRSRLFGSRCHQNITQERRCWTPYNDMNQYSGFLCQFNYHSIILTRLLCIIAS